MGKKVRLARSPEGENSRLRSLPLRGMKAKVEYHMLSSLKKMFHSVNKLALRGGVSPASPPRVAGTV